MKVYSSSLYNTAYGNDFEITSPKQHLVNNFQLYGTTYQNGTPTVTSPITPSSVTGRQTISIDVSNYPYNYNIDLSFVMNGIGNYRDRIYKDDSEIARIDYMLDGTNASYEIDFSNPEDKLPIILLVLTIYTIYSYKFSQRAGCQ